ncbi:bifunctional riboflavin kinase/FAD synthetase [soil metagenome]
MTIIRNNEAIAFDVRSAITVGTFDGVHCGHQGILQRMRTVADAHGERTVVVTFDPHPQIVLAKEGREPVELLTTIDERCALLAQQGVDVTVIVPFTKEFATTEAETFVRELIARIGAQHFFIGHDHMFGKDRGGNEELLKRLGPQLGFELEAVGPLDCNGVTVSSTKIRQALKGGEVESAQGMLGRPYSISGTVVRGDGRGATLGIPTANIQPSDEHRLIPGNGVYLVRSTLHDKQVWGMANIGRRPTFTDGSTTTIEVHYLDFDEMLYDQTVTIEFMNFIRHEQRFESTDVFLSQLREDRMQCLEIIASTT